MLAVDFKAAVDVSITFDDTDDEDTNDNKKEVKKYIAQLDNQNVEKSSPNLKCTGRSKDFIKNDNAVSSENNIVRKRKSESVADVAVENTAKHTIITTTHGQTHIIVASPKNTSPLTDEMKNANQYLDNLLKTISEHLVLIMEASQQFSAQDLKLIAIKQHLFNISYSTVICMIAPQENDILFTTRLLKETLRLCKEKNTVNITNEQQIFPFYIEMLEWAKRKQKQLQEIKFVNCKEQNQINVTDKSAQTRNRCNRNPSDDSNRHLINLLQQSEIPRRNSDVPDLSKNTTMPYSNSNIPYTNHSSTGQGIIIGQTNPLLASSGFSRSVVPPVIDTVINTMPSQEPSNLSYYNNFSLQKTPGCQNQYQQVQHGLSQMTPSGQAPFWQAQQGLPRVIPPPQKTQTSMSQNKNTNQSLHPHMQQGLAQVPFRDDASQTMTTNSRNVFQNTQQAQFIPSNGYVGFAGKSHLREHGNSLYQSLENAINHKRVQQLTYQNSYIQTETDHHRNHHMQWAPNKQPPPYPYCQPPRSSNKTQQLAQAVQTITPAAQSQLQHEPQQPEVTRSMSTDSGIVSPLPNFNPTDATVIDSSSPFHVYDSCYPLYL